MEKYPEFKFEETLHGLFGRHCFHLFDNVSFVDIKGHNTCTMKNSEESFCKMLIFDDDIDTLRDHSRRPEVSPIKFENEEEPSPHKSQVSPLHSEHEFDIPSRESSSYNYEFSPCSPNMFLSSDVSSNHLGHTPCKEEDPPSLETNYTSAKTSLFCNTSQVTLNSAKIYQNNEENELIQQNFVDSSSNDILDLESNKVTDCTAKESSLSFNRISKSYTLPTPPCSPSDSDLETIIAAYPEILKCSAPSVSSIEDVLMDLKNSPAQEKSENNEKTFADLLTPEYCVNDPIWPKDDPIFTKKGPDLFLNDAVLPKVVSNNATSQTASHITLRAPDDVAITSYDSESKDLKNYYLEKLQYTHLNVMSKTNTTPVTNDSMWFGDGASCALTQKVAKKYKLKSSRRISEPSSSTEDGRFHSLYSDDDGENLPETPCVSDEDLSDSTNCSFLKSPTLSRTLYRKRIITPYTVPPSMKNSCNRMENSSTFSGRNFELLSAEKCIITNSTICRKTSDSNSSPFSKPKREADTIRLTNGRTLQLKNGHTIKLENGQNIKVEKCISSVDIEHNYCGKAKIETEGENEMQRITPIVSYNANTSSQSLQQTSDRNPNKRSLESTNDGIVCKRGRGRPKKLSAEAISDSQNSSNETAFSRTILGPVEVDNVKRKMVGKPEAYTKIMMENHNKELQRLKRRKPSGDDFQIRSVHNSSERKRRKILKDYLLDLKNAVPATRSAERAPMATILKRAKEYIKEQEMDEKSLAEVKEQLFQKNLHLKRVRTSLAHGSGV